jgi:hypothetical protein
LNATREGKALPDRYTQQQHVGDCTGVFDVALWSELQELLMTLLRSQIAPSTATAYAAHERYFLHFLARLYGASRDMDTAVCHMRMQLRDPSAHVIASYVAYLARPDPGTNVRRAAYTTIKQYLKGVAHLLKQYNEAGVLSDMFLVQVALQAARRTNGVPSKPKAPITPDVLQFFVASLSRSTSAGAAMRAAMLICFFAMLRKCCVCADRTQPSLQLYGPAAR